MSCCFWHASSFPWHTEAQLIGELAILPVLGEPEAIEEASSLFLSSDGMDRWKYELFIEKSPKKLSLVLEDLKKIDKYSFEKSDNLLALSLDELTKNSVTVFLAKATSDAESKIVGYLLYSHTKLEGYSRIIKVEQL